MDIKVLGGILKNIDNFDMSTFNGRLILQKTIYFFQVFDMYLGYRFSWYLYGPYCTDLADDGYKLSACYDDVPSAVFADKKLEENFNLFISFLGNKKNNAEWLESLASIHFLKKLYPKMSKEEIIKKVIEKQKYFNRKKCESACSFLIKNKLIEDR